MNRNNHSRLSDSISKSGDQSKNKSSSKFPLVSVIIAVYKHEDFLEKIFLSLLNQTEQQFEIVIADDGSGSEIAHLIKTFQEKFHFPIHHAWHEDQGFRKTVIANKAVLMAQSSYLIFIDGDCILHHRFVERHLKRKKSGHLLAGRRVMLTQDITRRITNKDIITKKIEQPRFWIKNCLLYSKKYGFYNTLWYNFRYPLLNAYEFIGCNFSLFKSDFIEINGYDERIITRGLEDNNLCSRLKRKGLHIRYLAREAIQYHLFHTFEHVHYDQTTINEFTNQNPWSPYGIIKE